MAIFHLSAQILGRAPRLAKDGSPVRPGSSAVAAAAYRAGERLTDTHTGAVHDYSRREGVAHSEIMAPEGTPAWLLERESLWSHVEAMETRKDAQLAREINVALPAELNHNQRLQLVREFVRDYFISRGMIADIALHNPKESDKDQRNFHAHIMLTLRRASAKGLNPVKSREWNKKELLGEWRAAFASYQNHALREAGHKGRVDHRTLKAQHEEALARRDHAAAARLDRAPEIHVGPRARRIAEKGRAPASRSLPAGPHRRRDGAPPARRERTYVGRDHGTRVGWLTTILLGNNERAKADITRLDRKVARWRRKLDHWERRSLWTAEGAIKGRAFRWQRAQAAAEEQRRREDEARRREHAARRARQVREIVRELELVLVALRGGREAVLARQRQVDGWSRAIGREAQRQAERDHGRSRSR